MKNSAKQNPMYIAVLAALLSASALSVNAHAAVTPEIRSEVRTVIIDSDDAAEQAGERAFANGEVLLSRSGGEGKRDVRIVTAGTAFDFDMPDVNVIVSNAMSEAFSGVASRMPMRNIKNAPYSAEVISEKVQTLPDGNQISKKTSSMAYRDSAGRTRQEIRDSNGEVRSIHINDAVGGNRYVLSPSKKNATRISTLDKDLQKRIEEIREKAKAMAKDGKAYVIENGNPNEKIIVKRVETPGEDGRKELREEVKVNVVRLSDDANISAGESGIVHLRTNTAQSGRLEGLKMKQLALAEEMASPGALGSLFQDRQYAHKSTTTSLGTKEMEGVRVEGKNVSYTIPAGQIGNKNPIVVSTETWTSPDLQVVVYSKHSDPRAGDTIYRLANLKHTEQPMSLFTVPEGYNVKDGPALAPLAPLVLKAPPAPPAPKAPPAPSVK